MAKYPEGDIRNNGHPITQKNLAQKAHRYMEDSRRKAAHAVVGKDATLPADAEKTEKIEVPLTTAGTPTEAQV